MTCCSPLLCGARSAVLDVPNFLARSSSVLFGVLGIVRLWAEFRDPGLSDRTR